MFRKILVASGGSSCSAKDTAERLQALLPEVEAEAFHLDPARSGDLLDELLHRAAAISADLLVVGARSHVTARRIAMLAPCSVLMVPDGATLGLDRILVPVDFSEASSDAVKVGTALARAAGGECHFVSVECDDDPWLDWRDQPEQLSTKLREFVRESEGEPAWNTCLVEAIRHSGDALADVGLHAPAHAIEGADIASTIVSKAGEEKSTLIVLGTRGRSRAASILVGSVTEKVVQFSPVPVLAVKQRGARLGLLRGLLERLRRPPALVAS